MMRFSSFPGWTLSRISLVNWSGFVLDDIDISPENALITAANGTGKTAIFDAVAVCIGGGESYDVKSSNENSALGDGAGYIKKGRTPLAYILGTFQGGRTRESAVGFIGLTYENRIKRQTVSIIVRMAGRYGDDKLSEQNSLIAVGLDVSTADFVKNGIPVDWDEFRDHMNARKKRNGKADIKTFSASTRSEFRKIFMELVTPKGTRLSYRRYQKLLNMMKQGVATKGDFKEGDFIRNHIMDGGEDTKIKLGEAKKIIFTHQEQIKKKRAFHSVCESIFTIDELFQEKMRLKKELESKTSDMHHTDNVLTLRDLFHFEDQHLSSCSKKQKLDSITAESEEEKGNLVEKNAELKNCEAARIIKEREIDLKEVNRSITHHEKEVNSLSDKIAEDRSILSLVGLDYDNTNQIELNGKISELDKKFGDSQAELNQKEKELTKTKNNINELKNGHRASFRMLDDAEAIHRQYMEHGINAIPLYKLVDSVDDEYALAIESVMNTMRFDIIPKTMDDFYKAKSLLSHRRISLIHPEMNGYSKEGSLAKHVHTHNPIARAYLDKILGNMFPSNKDGKNNLGDNTVDLVPNKYNCLSRFSSYKNKNIDCVQIGEFVFGKMTPEQIQKTIVGLSEDVERLSKEVGELKSKISNSNILRKKLEKVDLDISLVDIETELKKLTTRRSAIEAEIEELQANNDVLEEISKNDNRIAELNDILKKNKINNEKLVSEIGRMEVIIDNLRSKFSKDIVVEYEKINEEDDILKTPNKEFEEAYFDKYKDYSVTNEDVVKVNESINKNSEKIRKQRYKMNQDNNQKYRHFPNYYEECERILYASHESDEKFTKAIDAFKNNYSVQNRDSLDGIIENIQKSLQEINEVLKKRYFRSAHAIIEDVRKNMRILNGSLKNIIMHGGRYSFESKPFEEMKKLIELIDYAMRNFEVLPVEEWGEDMQVRYQKLVTEISECDEDDILFDPTNWFNFEIRVTANGSKMTLSEWIKGGSGGMKKVPGYVALLGAVKSITALTKDESGLVTLFIDEAMEQIDTRTSISVIELFKEAGIQVIYLTNSSNFPKTAVSQIIDMHLNDEKRVIIDNPIHVGEPVKKETRESVGRFSETKKTVTGDMFNA